VVAQHRQSWADWGARKYEDYEQPCLHSLRISHSLSCFLVMLSKAELMHFSLELQKKLDIKYKSPPLPVDLSMLGQQRPDEPDSDQDSGMLTPASATNAPFSPDLRSLQAQFAPKSDRKKGK